MIFTRENELNQIKEAVEINILLKFIQDTKEGKFTSAIPTVADVTYQRLEIQEQGEDSSTDQNEVILFGVS